MLFFIIKKTFVSFVIAIACLSVCFADEAYVELYQEDMEDRYADQFWVPSGWDVIDDGGNYVLSGAEENRSCILTTGHDWTDYNYNVKIKLLSGSSFLHFRYSAHGTYSLLFAPDGVSLKKHDVDFTLVSDQIPNPTGTWHNVEIKSSGCTISIFVNYELRLEYTDTTNPLLHGRIAFEVAGDATAYIDDITILGKEPAGSLSDRKWTKTGGPSGGLGYDVRINPANKQIMYVTDDPSGVQKSVDGGVTWSSRNNGITRRVGFLLDNFPVFCLTLDPNNPEILWTGTREIKGIYKSMDGGETWLRKDIGIVEGDDEITFRGFGVTPGNSNIVFAAAELPMNEGSKGKIYKSTDGGESWRDVWEGDSLARFVLIDYSNPEIMYASTGIFDVAPYNDTPVGILKSTDGGESWFQINNGIPSEEGNRYVGFLEMHPQNPQILFAASSHAGADLGGIFRTTNGGQNWEKVLAEDYFSVVTISPSSPDIVYAGSNHAFYRSEDGGDTWTKYQKSDMDAWGPPGVRASWPISAVVDPNDSNTVYCNNYKGGLFKSTDGSKSWVDSSKGYTGASIKDLAIHPGNPAIVFVFAQDGPFKTVDGGNTWTGILTPPLDQGLFARTININPAIPQEMLLSDEYNGYIFKSTDGGDSWRVAFQHPSQLDQPELKDEGFKAIAYAPSDPEVVYAGMRVRDGLGVDFEPQPGHGMYKSTDGGDTWSEINNGLNTPYFNVNCVAVHPTSVDTLYIGTWQDGVFKSTDGGQNWVLRSNGLQSGEILSLAIDPENPDVVYAGLSGGVGIFKTTNGGEQWESINNGISLLCPSDLMSVGQVEHGISLGKPLRTISSKRSSFAGSVNYNKVPWTAIVSIVLDPNDPQTIYAADAHSGVYMSTDAGAEWTPFNEGLSQRSVSILSISLDGKILYAGTEGAGVFRLGTLETTSSTTSSTSPTTTTTTKEEICPTEKIYGEYSGQTKILRCFRDEILSKSSEGQEIIRLYYEWSHAIVEAMVEDEEFRKDVKVMIDGVLELIRDAE